MCGTQASAATLREYNSNKPPDPSRYIARLPFGIGHEKGAAPKEAAPVRVRNDPQG
jgi:hypothetical protein